MKSIATLVLVGICACIITAVTASDKFADNVFIEKQKCILENLQHIYQTNLKSEHLEVAKKFNLNAHIDQYKNTTVVDKYIDLIKHGILSRNDVFSIMNKNHREEAIALFHLFYYANDWETFYQTMVWARYNVNSDLFVYALRVAVIHRSDLAGIVLPPVYEMNPYYFFNSDVIQKAQQHMMQEHSHFKEDHEFVINVNYTGKYSHINDESKLEYFTEDIGLNAYSINSHASYPFWMGGEEHGLYKDRRGEYYIFYYRLLLSRYYMERLSNGLGKIPEFSWKVPIETGYHSKLRYYNGDCFPNRDNNYVVYNKNNFYDIHIVEGLENRIRDAIDNGFVITANGEHIDLSKPLDIDVLGNLIQSNPDSKQKRFNGYIEIYCKLLLGSPNYMTIPSSLDHYETTMRDPMFYQLYNRMTKYVTMWENHLPSYKLEEISFSGVKIESVNMDKLVTYFDEFDTDITNTVDLSTHQKPNRVVIKARQLRLNHLPFTYKLNVVSDKTQKGDVKVFLGPKYDEFNHIFDIEENRENFYLLDHYIVDMKEGKNVFTRNCNESRHFISDQTTFQKVYNLVLTAKKGDTKFPLTMGKTIGGFPWRLMLPKGKVGGWPVQFYFIIVPYSTPATPQFTGFNRLTSSGIGSGARFMDSIPFTYPFDRRIDVTNWFTSNMYYHDTMIYHKEN